MSHKADFGILTVVGEAWSAAQALFGEPTEVQPHSGQDWWVWDLEVEDGGSVRVVIDSAVDRFNIPAQEAATTMLDVWRPRFLLVADIGGGFADREGLKLGDLIVASGIEYYSLVKETPDGDEARDFPFQPPAPGPRKGIGHLHERVQDWWRAIPAARPETVEREIPAILQGQVIGGERLLSDPNSPTVAALAERYPKALAVDMETVGVARAVYAAQQKEIFTQFGMLRGVSDYVDLTGLDNQETRDDTKPYAAAVALAAAYAYIRTHPSAGSVLAGEPAGLAGTAPLVEDPAVAYLGELQSVLAARPPIAGSSFRLLLHGTKVRIEGSAAPGDGDRVEREDLLDLVEHDKLVVVVGKSGAGKTALLDATARLLAADDKPVVVRIDLKTGWSPSWAEAMADKPFDDRLAPSMDALLSASSPRLSIARLDQLIASHDVLFLVDALNEVPPEAKGRIRLTLSQYARRYPQVRVLATDRRIDLDYREGQWTALELPPLESDEAGRIVDNRFGPETFERLPEARREILQIPFFLDRALRQKSVDFTSRADAVEGFLHDGGIDTSDLDLVGEVALGVLLRGETTLSQEDLERLSLHGALEKLREGGFIDDGPAGAVFSHQLIHQYLAGRRVAAESGLWRPDVMDSLTSDAASLDGVGMAIAAIDEVSARDRFLQLVHDWNWRAAIVALSEARVGDRAVSEAMEQAVLAMAAEKRFDPVIGTRDRINGLLKTVDCETAEELQRVDENGLFTYIAAVDHPETEWWAEWKQAFVLFDPEILLNEQTIARIGSDMPLIGWMVANALRRVQPSEQASQLMRTVYRSHPGETPEARSVRWRALHTLGAWPAHDNAGLLLAALDDSHMWCRYGATRSTVEMAARTPDHTLRDWIIEQLFEVWPKLDAEPLSQLAWASRYIGADPDWPSAIRPLIQAVREAQEEEELDRWTRRLSDFDRYAESHIPVSS
ncbi:MAG TPA: hypothetical protein VFI03_10950 [Solirubrobacterales bacterium]|nr:hypothetical protein [Solirubrobacterales bacterium]